MAPRAHKFTPTGPNRPRLTAASDDCQLSCRSDQLISARTSATARGTAIRTIATSIHRRSVGVRLSSFCRPGNQSCCPVLRPLAKSEPPKIAAPTPQIQNAGGNASETQSESKTAAAIQSALVRTLALTCCMEANGEVGGPRRNARWRRGRTISQRPRRQTAHASPPLQRLAGVAASVMASTQAILGSLR
jgi:hypothetical protein